MRASLHEPCACHRGTTKTCTRFCCQFYSNAVKGTERKPPWGGGVSKRLEESMLPNPLPHAPFANEPPMMFLLESSDTGLCLTGHLGSAGGPQPYPKTPFLSQIQHIVTKTAFPLQEGGCVSTARLRHGNSREQDKNGPESPLGGGTLPPFQFLTTKATDMTQTAAQTWTVHHLMSPCLGLSPTQR